MAFYKHETHTPTAAEIEHEERYKFERKLKREIRQDLVNLESILSESEKKTEEELRAYYHQLTTKYHGVYENLGDTLYEYDSNSQSYNPYALEKSSLIYNLESIKNRFEMFINIGLKPSKKEKGDFINNIQTSANAQASSTINLTFKSAMQDIENMTTLSDAQIKDILERINELEKIVSSSEKARTKWGKAKGILNWLSTQGVDVAMKVIPLLLKISPQ